MSISMFLSNTYSSFCKSYSSCVVIMQALLKYRKPLVMDRLPPFLQQYRTLLTELCKRSDSGRLSNQFDSQQLADCAHQLERLTKVLVDCGKYMSRISMYLIADILHQYEVVTIHPNVKVSNITCKYCP